MKNNKKLLFFIGMIFSLIVTPNTSFAHNSSAVQNKTPNVFLTKVKETINSNINYEGIEKQTTELSQIPTTKQSKPAGEYIKKLAKKNKKKKVTVKATAYTANCKGCTGITKTGYNLNKNPEAKVIAVDPDIIPLGSTLYVPGYGLAKAVDTGGAINGHHIDVYFESRQDALDWGVKHMTVTIVS